MTDDTPHFPTHDGCEQLTGLTVDHLPTDGTINRVRRYLRDEAIWRADDAADRIYFLRRGEVLVTAPRAGDRDLVLQIVEAGEPFGELCFCQADGASRRDTTATASADSEVIEVRYRDFLDYLQAQRTALTALLVTFCLRLVDAESRMRALAEPAAEQRLGRVLVQLARTRGRATTEGRTRVIVPVTHERLADMAAMARAHVTVTMGRLRDRGLVDYGRARPLTVDVAALQAFVDAPWREPSGHRASFIRAPCNTSW